MRYQLHPDEFQRLVELALDDLPPYFRAKMDNIALLVRPWPSRRDLAITGTQPGHTLLGLYHGIPLTERTGGYTLVPPDTITIYQGPIEQQCGDPAAIPALVRRVVIHEIAHHFGISDDRLRELGAY